ncbi:hypothetical protein PF008_g5377 [Phytophthora fragariae]|uniref:Uncharacterized protein n=1 Tax=Phytophthora fragariae TaxID=53985 RepID=A0A6G0S968_9STRA|nr:hypothetical protein PF008_g5377 [Phytophthora fragariae]
MPTIDGRTTITTAISTSSIVVEFFTHWRAFVYFQQLQDSSVLFQLPQHHPKKQMKSPQKSPKLRRSNDQQDATDELVPYGPQPQPLPRKKFNSKKEWLLPLYATIDVVSSSTGPLKTPFYRDVERTLASPCRFVLAEEQHVIHFTRVNSVATEPDSFGVHLTVFNITFVHDESCSLDSLLKLKGAYVWLIVPRKPRNNREVPVLPTEWMVDLYRFVQHPTLDFQSPDCQQVNHFRVRMSWRIAERSVEAAFWSKNVDWRPSISSTDLYNTVLRQIFDALCRSHPPAFGVDSVKFSKLLYEAKIQPNLLAIGDAAFLFASNLTPGFTYEMDFDGFVRAVEWLAQQFYSEKSVKVKTSSSKILPGVQHAMMKWQLSRREENDARDRLLSPLRRFCYETLVHLPSLSSTWHDIMDSWRLARKQQCLQEYAMKYCAATRLRASWVGFVTWRIFLQRRQRMREERLAATKLQSVARGRTWYLDYQRMRRIVTRTQLRIHARSELRRLRAERAAFIERMRLRMVRWMRYHLWLLREWKRVNAELAARRARIREKRLRRLGVAIFPLDNRRVRFTLYRAQPKPSEIAQCDAYELEIVNSSRSWGQVFYVSQQQIDQFIVEEIERSALQLELGQVVLDVTARKETPTVVPSLVAKLLRGRKQVNASVVRDSVAHPVLKPNIVLLALARRLAIVKRVDRSELSLHCYSDPIDTSLGQLVFKGALRSQLSQGVSGPGCGKSLVQRHIVRVLDWAGTLKFIVYTPSTSARRRYDLAASFVLSVLQFSRFDSMNLHISDGGDDINAADEEEQPSLRDLQYSIHLQIHRIVTGSLNILALQCVLSYLLQYGVCTPTYSMLPHVIAERERRLKDRKSAELSAILARERQLIVKVQTRCRLRLARITRLQLALSSYSKEFHRDRGQFVYVMRRSGDRIVVGERKPFSLFDQDVPLPADEWLIVSASATADSNIRFVNPRRGVYSRYNDVLAATIIQRWFRGKMWDGINNWKLREIALALSYHSDVQKPSDMTDPRQLEIIKRYALQLHVLQHQYKAAYPLYEAALKLSPNDPQTLVCLASLLVISCRYPAAQSWARAMELLKRAHTLVGSDNASTLHEIEQNGFRWALFLQPKNPHTIANYAVYLQCVHLDIDKAELLYRRALDLDPVNDLFVTNFQRLQSERAPGRLYAFAGPGTIALARSSEVRRCGPEFQWREMEDPAAQPPMPKCFFHNLSTGKCTWTLPIDGQPMETSPGQDSAKSTETSC